MLRIEGVVAGYGRGDILRGLDLSLEQGTITCLVGPNRAGKSTVLKTLSGLLHARDGRILLDGVDISRLSPARVLPRDSPRRAGPKRLPADDRLGQPADGRSHPPRPKLRRAEHRSRKAFPCSRSDAGAGGTLSGGQQKFVEIARALMLEPRLS